MHEGTERRKGIDHPECLMRLNKEVGERTVHDPHAFIRSQGKMLCCGKESYLYKIYKKEIITKGYRCRTGTRSTPLPIPSSFPPSLLLSFLSFFLSFRSFLLSFPLSGKSIPIGF